MKKTLSFLILVLAIFLAACQHQAVAPKQSFAGGATLSGRITEAKTGTPVEGAFVYVYKATNHHFFGPSDYMSLSTNTKGYYSVELPPGNYFIFARWRKSGSFQGPLYKEDYFSEGSADTKTIPSGKTTVNLTVQKLEGQQFYRPEKFGAKTSTVVTGVILDHAGKPVLGAYVFAYHNTFRKREPPDYGSVSVDANGRYYLYLDEGGEYIVGARMKAKEPPEAGEPLGFYHNDREKPLTVATGNIMENIDIVLSPFAGTPAMKPAFIPLQY